MMNQKFQKHDHIQNKRGKSKWYVESAHWTWDPNTDSEGFMYRLAGWSAHTNKRQFKYVFGNDIDNYEFVPATDDEIAEEQRKADEASAKLSAYCKANGGAVAITPPIIGKILGY
jgi:hypothetical protein